MTIIATGHRSEFGYDGLGRRVEIIEKDPDATQTLQITSDKKYLWDGMEIAEERDATGGIVQKRFYSQGFVDTDGTILLYMPLDEPPVFPLRRPKERFLNWSVEEIHTAVGFTEALLPRGTYWLPMVHEPLGASVQRY